MCWVGQEDEGSRFGDLLRKGVVEYESIVAPLVGTDIIGALRDLVGLAFSYP
jgi:hypothetical protein